MRATFDKNDVVQFIENHKWCGCLGIIKEVKELDNDTRYLIGIPVPQSGTAYIYSMGSKKEFEYIGDAIMVEPDNE